MSAKPVVSMILICCGISLAAAQSISVDMDTASGIQPTVATEDTGQTLVIPIRINDADHLFSYQFKIAFDTGSFTFLGAQQDFGITGEKNILTKNGGTTIGIFQVQVNPPADDTVEFSCSLTGTDDTKSVSGDGLIGVLYLKSRLNPGDSAAVAVSQGFLAPYGGTLTPVATYAGGMYRVLLPVTVNRSANRRTVSPSTASAAYLINILIGTTEVHFDLPAALFDQDGALSITLFSLDGRLQASRRIPLHSGGISGPVAVQKPCGSVASGAYLCTVAGGTTRISRTIRIP